MADFLLTMNKEAFGEEPGPCSLRPSAGFEGKGGPGRDKKGREKRDHPLPLIPGSATVNSRMESFTHTFICRHLVEVLHNELRLLDVLR